MLEDMLLGSGCQVAASVARLPAAWKVLESVPFDFAVLDINIAGETSFDLARALAARGIPYIFSTGYGTGGLPPDMLEQRVLTKPFGSDDLMNAVTACWQRK
jgi:CheY-like chemotaxis protein